MPGGVRILVQDRGGEADIGSADAPSLVLGESSPEPARGVSECNVFPDENLREIW